MTELLLQTEHIEQLSSELLGHGRERCAALLVTSQSSDGQVDRIIGKELIFPSEPDYLSSSTVSAELSPHFVARLIATAKAKGLGIAFVHSHPGSEPPEFSLVDDRGEEQLAAFARRRIPHANNASIVISRGGFAARILGGDLIRLVEIGAFRRVLFDPGSSKLQMEPRFDRQVRAFGAEGQRLLSRLRVGIVGLGGTGSIVAEQLAHLGIKSFLLIDADTLEDTNLNRVAGATPEDIGKSKVLVSAQMIRRINPAASVNAIVGDVTRTRYAQHLLNCDLIFGCTDSHGSRAVLQQIAYQYLIICIDVGSTIVVDSGSVTHVHGRVQMLAPGLPCFTCTNLLDGTQVRRDMMTEFERQTDPYISGAGEPAPSVMPLNSIVSSLAISMLMSVITGVGFRPRHLLYNALVPSVRAVSVASNPNCVICSSAGVLAAGQSMPLMARAD